MSAETIYHRTTGIPKELAVPRPGQIVQYSRHAGEEARLDYIRELPRYLPPVFDHIETVEHMGRACKWLVRVPCHTRRNGQWQDLCIVLTPSGFALTVWLNAAIDDHPTLRTDRVTKETTA